MRKLNRKAIVSFNIYTAAIVLILVLFVVIVLNVSKAEAAEYTLPAGSIVFDKSDYPITTAVDGRITKTVDNCYVLRLATGGREYSLGATSVAYEQQSGKVRLFGDGYRVFGDGSVNKLGGETRIEDFSSPSFFKLDDRKYVIVGAAIQSEDQLVQASNFLYVVLDKNGNAQLLNDLVNLKTVEPIVLVCGNVYFNVAEERLMLDNREIDLTKILGTSNEYMPAPKEGEPGYLGEDGEIIIRGGSGGDGGAGGSGGTGGTGGSGGKGGTGVTGEGGGGSETFDFSLNNVLSLRSVLTKPNAVEVHYLINDPTGAYATAFLRVRSLVDDGTGSAIDKRIGLNTDSTYQVITGLNPGMQYSVTIGYRPLDAQASDPDRIADTVRIVTPGIMARIRLDRLSRDEVKFNLLLDASFKIDSGQLVLYADGHEQSRTEINSDAVRASSGWTSSLTYKGGTNMELCFENIVYDGKPVSLAYNNIKFLNTTSSALLSPLSVLDSYTANPSLNEQPQALAPEGGEEQGQTDGA